jgi:hypothetical protein
MTAVVSVAVSLLPQQVSSTAGRQPLLSWTVHPWQPDALLPDPSAEASSAGHRVKETTEACGLADPVHHEHVARAEVVEAGVAVLILVA